MKNTFWAIPVTLIVAARNKQEAKRILWAQIEEMSAENLNNAAIDSKDYCGVMGYIAGALKPEPDPKFEKMFRKTWGDYDAAGSEPFTKQKGDGLLADERLVEQWAKQESVHKHTGKRKNKR